MFTRRQFLQITTATSVASLLPKNLASAAFRPAAAKPNILLIMVDDLCPTSLGCYGASGVKTPNIDRLARRGVKFERAYCQFPICNPSRASLITGRRPHNIGVLSNFPDDVYRNKLPGVVALPQLFRESGYFTGSVGKIIHHGTNPEGNPAEEQDPKSWDVCRGPMEVINEKQKGEHANYTAKLNGDGRQANWCWWLAEECEDDALPDHLIASNAIQLLEEHREKPFFIAVGFHKPHDPYVAPKKYFDMYSPGSVTLPDEPGDRTAIAPMAVSRADRFAKFSAEDRLALKRAYYACTTFVDAQVGRLLDTLDRLALWDNTIVVLVADHGYHLWEHGHWGKVTVYEPSCRVPLVVWAPGLQGMGKGTQGIVESLDLYPTLAELCGLRPPAGLAGASFSAQLKDPSAPGKDAAYTELFEDKNATNDKKRNGQSVRTSQWRYTEWDDGCTSLFDHVKDPGEYYNVASSPEHKETCARLSGLLKTNCKTA